MSITGVRFDDIMRIVHILFLLQSQMKSPQKLLKH